jgi:hypothetical protein
MRGEPMYCLLRQRVCDLSPQANPFNCQRFIVHSASPLTLDCGLFKLRKCRFTKLLRMQAPLAEKCCLRIMMLTLFANGQVLRMRERRHSSVRFSNAGHDEPIHPRNLVMGTSGDVWLIDWAFTGAYP